MEADINNLEDLAKLKKMVALYYSRYAKSLTHVTVDDVYNTIILRNLEGSNSIKYLKFAVINIIRDFKGRRFEKAKFDTACQYSEKIASEDESISENKEELIELGNKLPLLDRIIFKLYFVWGFKEVEIASIFNRDYSLISKRISSIQEKFRQRILKDDVISHIEHFSGKDNILYKGIDL
jgi:DNA-directed RNA polymerase specialized sigma24 family protein